MRGGAGSDYDVVVGIGVARGSGSCPLDEDGVDVLDAPEWQALVEAASDKKTVTLNAPEDADLSGVEAVYVLGDKNSRAGDLVRALSILTKREGLKVYIVWPEREEDQDWWSSH